MKKSADRLRRACSALPPSCSRRSSGARGRAPDASIRGAGGSSKRLFELFKGTHWTLLGYEVERGLVPPRSRLHIHTFGTRGDLIDEHGNFSNAYAVASG